MSSAEPSGSNYAARNSPRSAFTGSHMLNVKSSRHRSENDVKLLQNRLERLHVEERKALKKIEETRRRADQIIQLKTRNVQTNLRKQMDAEYVERQREKARERLQTSQAGNREAVRANAQAVTEQKRQEATVLREQRVLIEDHLRQQRDEHIRRNQRINSLIKEHAAEVQRTKMQQRMLHEESLQADMEQRMVEEENKRNVADQAVAHLEEEEEIAIERLRRTQEAQKSAYDELERALINPPPPLDQRAAAMGDILRSGIDGVDADQDDE